VNLIQRRASLLKINHVYVGKDNKLEVLKEWCEKSNINLAEVAYIGDDLNDMECMQSVGISACPADAAEKIKKISSLILKRNGGDACVREFIEMYWEI
jgi:3-deoxy-D-manno-octulosonate 8-phosphate phosphatase (KDO 8-P phosphatase)